MTYKGKLKNNQTDALFNAILSLKSLDDMYCFFEDIATIQEIKDLTLRLQVAMRLHRGETYAQIESETGASATTISRVNRSLVYGADGYAHVLNKEEGKHG